MQFINHLYIHRRYPCAGHSMYLCNAYNAFLPHFSCKCNGHLHLAHKHWNHLLYQGCDTYILQNKQNKQSHWYTHLITKFNFSFFFQFFGYMLIPNLLWTRFLHKMVTDEEITSHLTVTIAISFDTVGAQKFT